MYDTINFLFAEFTISGENVGNFVLGYILSLVIFQNMVWLERSYRNIHAVLTH